MYYNYSRRLVLDGNSELVCVCGGGGVDSAMLEPFRVLSLLIPDTPLALLSPLLQYS